ncbi:MAG: glutamine--fructose-6-phosphate transaminase (isomerizing) [Clostridia bacterium]|nr:glutamine--fructose-6-phosphate transaminase (isomerizing) [Clostridia bacterium]
MCGIIGYTGTNAVPYLIKGLEMLEYRGYDSAGIAVTAKGAIQCVKREGRVSRLRKAVDALPFSSTGIAHTRWATHGKPDETNAHPHISKSGIFAVVHNGIIENFSVLRTQLEKEGYAFTSQTDTEVIAHLLEKNYSGSVTDAMRETLPLLEGSYALGILCSEYPENIYFAVRSSPLTASVTPDGAFISSDPSVLTSYTKKAYRLKSGDFGRITKTAVEIFSADGKRVKRDEAELSESDINAEKGEFPHYMLKEIYEQPEAVLNTCRAYIRSGEVFFNSFPFDKKSIKKISRLYLVGCGSAYHAALTGKYVFELLTDIPCEAAFASEFRYSPPPLDSSTPVILISQSGETADTIAALRLAKEKSAHTLSVLNVRGCTMESESDCCFFTLAGKETAVATTKAYSAQLSLIYLLALHMGKLTGKLNGSEYGIILESVMSLPDRIRSATGVLDAQMRNLAKSIKDAGNVFFIGRGTDYPAAMEAALKLKEVSYIKSDAVAAGELKHGSISLIEKDTPVIALCCGGKTFFKTLSNVREVISRGARVICVTDSSHKKECSAFGEVITVPVSHPVTAPSLEIIPMQLLSYYTALLKGCDIDKPRNLAKSVTVE